MIMTAGFIKSDGAFELPKLQVFFLRNNVLFVSH